MGNRLLVVGLLSALIASISGCGAATTTVTGVVTYKGEKVANGWISFNPVDGEGAAGGGPITGGEYRVEKLTPGKKIAHIVGVKQVNIPRTGLDLSSAEREWARHGDASAVIPRADEIPADAVGNNTQVILEPGEKSLNFDLKPPGHS